MIVFDVRPALVDPPKDGPMIAALVAGPDSDHLAPLGRLICSREEFKELEILFAYYNFDNARTAFRAAERGRLSGA